MHHVYDMRTPERRTLTGCKWRISEPRTARTRLRFVLGMPSCNALSFAMGSLRRSQLNERVRIHPFAPFLVKLNRLVDDDLAVRRIEEDLRALERTRRRSLEVHSGLVVAAAVAGALEFVL